MQDAFVNVINHLEKIREINCNETRFYLVIIVKNISLNKLKKKQRHPEVDIDEVFDAQSDENVEAEALYKINSEVIREALCELSDKDYEIMFYTISRSILRPISHSFLALQQTLHANKYSVQDSD